MAEEIAAAEEVTAEETQAFLETYDCAKNGYQWARVKTSISEHPKWLTRVPVGRRWTMLHQIVFCGNVPHLHEVLSYQLNNEEFNLLTPSLDHKTVREVALERAHIYPNMMHAIEKMVALDKMFWDAREQRWDSIKQFLHQKPQMVNEKLPYRKWYLAHYLASIGQLEFFRDLAQFCPFRFDLLVDEKTISDIARENQFADFADYVDELVAHPLVPATAPTTEDAEGGPNEATGGPAMPFSPNFYDDPGITIFSVLPPPLATVFHIYDEYDPPGTAVAPPAPTTVQSAPAKPAMTAEEQETYENTIRENLGKLPSTDLLSSITCSITKNILYDPVVAADGFTYERAAILKWFEQSNRSPMTNQVLPHLDLMPNHAIKSILQSIIPAKKDDESSPADAKNE